MRPIRSRLCRLARRQISLPARLYKYIPCDYHALTRRHTIITMSITMKRCWHILINKFYLPAALFNLNNYKHIIVLHYFIPLFIHINDVMKAHIAKHNCNYVDMYYFLFFFLFNPMINGFCNRDNSTVLYVALPHLLQHRLM